MSEYATTIPCVACLEGHLTMRPDGDGWAFRCGSCGRIGGSAHPAGARRPTLNEQLGRRIRDRRRLLGLSQADLGSRLSPPVSHTSIVDVERGRVRIDLDRLDRIASALGVGWGDLLPA